MEKSIALFNLFKFEYEKGIDILIRLDERKFKYQRIFITLISLLGAVSIGFLKLESWKFFDSGLVDDVDEMLTMKSFIGMLLLFAFLLGYIILRNLVSLRRQSIYYNNAVIGLRQKYVHEFQSINKIDLEIPNLKKVEPNDRNSADYISIVVISVINGIMLVGGFSLMLLNSSSNLLTTILVAAISLIGYSYVHYRTINQLLSKKLVD